MKLTFDIGPLGNLTRRIRHRSQLRDHDLGEMPHSLPPF